MLFDYKKNELKEVKRTVAKEVAEYRKKNNIK